MASPPARFRPAVLTVASLLCLLGYVYAIRAAATVLPYYWASSWLALSFLASSVAAPVVYLARIVARTRLVGTGKDALARLRQWAADRPRATRALLAAPAVLGFLLSYDSVFVNMFGPMLAYRALPLPSALGYLLALWIGPSIALGLLARALGRGLLLPLTEDRPTAPAEQFSFSAVAVTPETRAAVGGVFALTVAAVALVANLPQNLIYTPAGAAGLAVYIAAVLGAAFAFQRASRIGLGFDGVLVTGSSRTRFFAYHDIDAVEAGRWGDVVLRRHGRVVLRLQLHGADEGRHVAIADRIREGLARARDPRGGGAARLADARGAGSLAHAAQGMGSFRAPGVTRDELWELVEAPGTAAPSRAAAAEALATGADAADRTRMRIAAGLCAAPEVRAVMERVAEAEAEDAGGSAEQRLLRLRPPGP